MLQQPREYLKGTGGEPGSEGIVGFIQAGAIRRGSGQKEHLCTSTEVGVLVSVFLRGSETEAERSHPARSGSKPFVMIMHVKETQGTLKYTKEAGVWE